jgi:chemotaxis signal transduction protein
MNTAQVGTQAKLQNPEDLLGDLVSNLDRDSHEVSPIKRYILASLGDRTLVFADIFVSEIMLVERAFILPLPFFMPALIGLAQYQGRLTPLLSLARLLNDANALIPEVVSVVCLKGDSSDPATEDVAGAGLIVDRVVGTVSHEQYADLLRADPLHDSKRYLTLEQLLLQIPSHAWQPNRWYASV